MKNLHMILFALVVSIATGSTYAASHLDRPIDPTVIVNAGGFEWVWAAPCATAGTSCGVPILRDGFVVPTQQQWLSTFNSNDALVRAFNNNGLAICAAPWFSTVHDHCDIEDLVDGFVWHAPYPIGNTRNNDPAAESFLVRAIPEPETYAMLLAGLGIVGFAVRRRRSAALFATSREPDNGWKAV